ncbi:hypothetical protein G7Y89_g1905 [Cudoniella acicularis]|uniref:Uncharacterized protein n=1 Tax=Cudoniella acicularis TaxID=354080 RepID=A0A8H4RUB6_9HELO|nr:hypothetical protein G7Y89_g1905 [Cudoniella acicularis]
MAFSTRCPQKWTRVLLNKRVKVPKLLVAHYAVSELEIRFFRRGMGIRGRDEDEEEQEDHETMEEALKLFLEWLIFAYLPGGLLDELCSLRLVNRESKEWDDPGAELSSLNCSGYTSGVAINIPASELKAELIIFDTDADEGRVMRAGHLSDTAMHEFIHAIIGLHCTPEFCEEEEGKTCYGQGFQRIAKLLEKVIERDFGVVASLEREASMAEEIAWTDIDDKEIPVLAKKFGFNPKLLTYHVRDQQEKVEKQLKKEQEEREQKKKERRKEREVLKAKREAKRKQAGENEAMLVACMEGTLQCPIEHQFDPMEE